MKTRIITKCVANHYAGPNERIIEFSHSNGGGLISFVETDDNRLIVEVYRIDDTVEVRFVNTEE